MMKKRWMACMSALLLACGAVGCGAENVADNENSNVLITLHGNSASCNSDSVKIEGTKIIISEEATYIFQGELKNGQIIVNAKEQDKPQIVLDGAQITNETSAALYVLEADKVVVTLTDGSQNILANGGTFEAVDDNNIDGAVFSKQDLTFNGSGKLTVTSPADHGIVCKDDLVFENGNYVIQSASHGVDANDSATISGANMSITAGKDGIHAENDEDTEKGFVVIQDGDFDISAEGDGISAGAYMQIKEGQFNIITGGGSENAQQKTSNEWGGFPGGMQPGKRGPYGMTDGAVKMPLEGTTDSGEADSSTSIKGLKASGELLIEGGNFVIDSADDAVHSNASIKVNGGTFAIESGDDAFHADDTLTISGGTIDIKECYEGLEALHVKVEGGDIKMVASDDGINAAGGTDSSGTGGVRGDDQFGGRGGMGVPGGQGFPGGMSGNSDGSIVISGGNLNINSSGDGLDANGYLEITGGYTVVTGPTQGDTATLDYDLTGTITGGTFIGTGGMMMAQSFSDSEQGVFAVQVGNCAAGTEFTLKDSDGKELVTHSPELGYAIIIVSTEEMVKGDIYTITVGEKSGEFQAQ